MTLVDTMTGLSERFLRERTFELVVAPAIADLQFDEPNASGMRRVRNAAAVLSAFAWGLYEDVTSESLLMFAGLALIPACYYTVLVFVCAPIGSEPFSTPGGPLLTAAVIVLSFGPVVACYWPERPPRRMPGDAP